MAHILLVEDNRFARNLISRQLTGAGHRVVAVADGTEALAALQVERPDLLLTDLLMPGMDGVGLIRRLRQAGDQLPIVVLSADIQRSTREQVEAYGVIGFLGKPHSADELAALVDVGTGGPT